MSGLCQSGRGPNREEAVSPLSVLLPAPVEVDGAAAAMASTRQTLCGRWWSDKQLEAVSHGGMEPQQSLGQTCAHEEAFSFKESLFCACYPSQLNLTLTKRPKRRLAIKTG